MNRKQLVINLVFLLCFPVLANAGTVFVHAHHNVNHGEFAAPTGVFNSAGLNIVSRGEFSSQGILSHERIFNDADSNEFKNPKGTFGQSSSEFSSSGSMFADNSGEFKFSLPK
jgi:hypothetical protein